MSVETCASENTFDTKYKLLRSIYDTNNHYIPFIDLLSPNDKSKVQFLYQTPPLHYVFDYSHLNSDSRFKKVLTLLTDYKNISKYLYFNNDNVNKILKFNPDNLKYNDADGVGNELTKLIQKSESLPSDKSKRSETFKEMGEIINTIYTTTPASTGSGESNGRAVSTNKSKFIISELNRFINPSSKFMTDNGYFGMRVNSKLINSHNELIQIMVGYFDQYKEKFGNEISTAKIESSMKVTNLEILNKIHGKVASIGELDNINKLKKAQSTYLDKMKKYGDFKIVPYSVYALRDNEKVNEGYNGESIKILDILLKFMGEIHNKININLAYIQYNALTTTINPDKKINMYHEEIEIYKSLLDEIRDLSKLGIKIFAVFYKIYNIIWQFLLDDKNKKHSIKQYLLKTEPHISIADDYNKPFKLDETHIQDFHDAIDVNMDELYASAQETPEPVQHLGGAIRTSGDTLDFLKMDDNGDDSMDNIVYNLLPYMVIYNHKQPVVAQALVSELGKPLVWVSRFSVRIILY